MTRILFASHSATLTGAPQALFKIASNIDRSRFEPLVLFPQRGPIIQRFEEAGVPVAVIDIGDSRWNSFHISMIEAFCVVKRIDFIHANTVHCYPFAMTAQKIGIPCFWYIHEMLKSGLSFGVEEAEFKRAIEGSATVGVATEASKRELLQLCEESGIRAPKPVVVNYGFEVPERYRPYQPDNVVKIISIGNLTPHKGYRFLIDAFAAVKSKNVSASLTILAGGDLRHLAPLWEQVERAGLDNDVHFLTPAPDIGHLIDDSDIVVSPSLVDNFSLSIAEAMAHGKPVVATDVGGIREFFIDGQTGIIVPQQNSDALAKAMLRFIEDPSFARACGERAREHIAVHFSTRKQAERLQEMYASLIRVFPAISELDGGSERFCNLLLESLVSANEKINRLEREIAGNKEYLTQQAANIERDMRALEAVVSNMLQRFPFNFYRKLKSLMKLV